MGNVETGELLASDGRPAADLWSLDQAVAHLNHGSYGAPPRFVLERETQLRDEMNADADAWWRGLDGRVASARERVAEWLCAPNDATALVANASAGAAAVIASLDIRSEDVVLVTDHNYGAVAMAARRRARSAGARVVTLRVPLAADDSEIVDLFRERIAETPGLKMILVDQITSPTGMLFPVADISALCRAAGVELLVDGAHGPGLIARPTEGLDGAYWVGNLHKWGLTPRGTGVLVANPSLPADRQRLFPSIDSWGSVNPFPQRFDLQGTLDYSPWLAVPAALDGVERRIGWQRYREHLAHLATAAQAAVADVWGAELADLPRNPAPSLRLVPLPDGMVTNEVQAHDLRDRIAAEANAAVAVTSHNGRGFVRLSAQVYNTLDDYVRFAESWNPDSRRAATAV